MKVSRNDISIPEPCHEDWDSMQPREHGRFCDMCTKDVHDLSSMTRDEALALLDERGSSHLCVRYAHFDDEVFFKDSTSPVWRLSRQLEGAKKLLAAALVVPLLAACEPQRAPDPEPAAVSPISLESGTPVVDTSTKTGAGIAPEFTPEPPRPVRHIKGEAPMIEEEMGDVEMLPEDEATPEIALGNLAVEHVQGQEAVPVVTKGDVAEPEPESACDHPEKPTTEPEPTRPVRHKVGKVHYMPEK